MRSSWRAAFCYSLSFSSPSSCPVQSFPANHAGSKDHAFRGKGTYFIVLPVPRVTFHDRSTVERFLFVSLLICLKKYPVILPKGAHCLAISHFVRAYVSACLKETMFRVWIVIAMYAKWVDRSLAYVSVTCLRNCLCILGILG